MNDTKIERLILFVFIQLALIACALGGISFGDFMIIAMLYLGFSLLIGKIGNRGNNN